MILVSAHKNVLVYWLASALRLLVRMMMTRFPGYATAIRPRKTEDAIKRIGRLARPLAVLLFVLGGWAPRGHAQTLAAPPGAQVMDLTPQPGYFTEPSIAVNPRDPQQVVAAFQDNAHISYSLDAGRHWQAASGIAPPNYRVSGDVSVTYDNHGHAILCYIAFDKLGTTNYWAHNAIRNGIFVRRSLDGGQTWEADHIPVAEQPTQPGIPFEDKPYIVADEGDGPYAGNLYVGWTRWTIEDSQILFSRSTDGGKTWSKPVEIDHHPGLPRDDNGANEGFAGVVGPDGTLYAVWADGNHILLTTSHDGGATFDAPRSVVDTAPIMFKVEDVDRSNGFPQIAIDPHGGARGGRLIVAWSDYRNGGVDVFCSASADHGQTWSPAVRVNSDPIHNGADHFFQWMTADPTRVRFIWCSTIAAAIPTIGKPPWCWRAPPTAPAPSPTMPGPRSRSTAGTPSSATTPASPHSMTECMEPGRRNGQGPPPISLGVIIRWSEWESQTSVPRRSRSRETGGVEC